MQLIVLGGLSAGHVRPHEKYLLEDERWLVAEAIVSADLSAEFTAMRSVAKSNAPTEALLRAVLSFDDAEKISPRRALDLAKETIAQTPFANQPGVLVVHGPPNEPTRLHVHSVVCLQTDEKLYRRAEARRALWTAACEVGERNGLVVPRSSAARYNLRVARAAQVWQTTPTLYSWICETVAPELQTALPSIKSWADLGGLLGCHGLRYVATPRGGGAIYDDSRHKVVRASAITLELSRTQLEQRFGPLPAFAPIQKASTLQASFAHAAASADEGEMERHRAARAAWSELYEPRIVADRNQLDRRYGDRCKDIAQTTKTLEDTLRELEFPPEEKRALLDATKDFRTTAIDEALHDHTVAMRELYTRYPKKPSRKLREWQKDRFTKHAPAGRIISFDARLPVMPPAPWHAAPSAIGGHDLYYDRRRVAFDDGTTVAILDADLPDEALASLPLPKRYRVEGPAPLRERIRILGTARNDTISDGGDPQDPPAPLHATLPEQPLARRCLALMDALRIRPAIDGVPYRNGEAIPPEPRRIELRDELVVIVHGANVSALADEFTPTAYGENCAIFRCADAYSATELRKKAQMAGLRVTEHVPASTHLRFTDAPMARMEAPPRPALDASILAPMEHADLDADLDAAHTRTRGRTPVPEQKRKRRR